MQRSKNERGSVLVFVTLMMVLLFVIVGMGLDTGHLSFVRSQGQPAVDAAALAAVGALPTLSITEVNKRAAALNYDSTSKMGNNYLDSSDNNISGSNVTLIKYDNASGSITAAASIADANGVRVALESSNPYNGSATPTPMKSPLFLTPLLNVLGQNTKNTQNVSVSAVAVLRAIPGFPVAIAGCNPPPVTAGCDVGGDGTYNNPYTNCKLLQVDSSNNGKGPNDNLKYQDSGWTTFTVPSANAPAIKALVRNNSTCANIPPVSDKPCIYLNNGQITGVLNEFESVYSNNSDPLDPNVNPGLSVTSKPYKNDWGAIPVVDPAITNFTQCQKVIGWAKFGIRNVVTSGSDKYLVGDLICGWSLNNVGGTSCYTTQLVRDKLSGM